MVLPNEDPERAGDASSKDALPLDEDWPDEAGGGYDPLDPDSDCFKPPAIPTEVHCLHCGKEYESYLIEWRVQRCRDGKMRGFWCCPTEGCGGAGFGFDLMPIDPEYVGEDGEPFWSFDHGVGEAWDDEWDDEWGEDEAEDESGSEAGGGLDVEEGWGPDGQWRGEADDDDVPF